MGEELVNSVEPPQNPQKKQTNTEMFYKELPQYLAIGMSAEEFWHGDVLLVIAYREAHKIKRQNSNFEAWLHNKYTIEAIANALYGKKAEYPEEPYPMSKKEVYERRRSKLMKRKKLLQAQAAANKANKAMEELKNVNDD